MTSILCGSQVHQNLHNETAILGYSTGKPAPGRQSSAPSRFQNAVQSELPKSEKAMAVPTTEFLGLIW
jgi:hypothetical protein